MKRTFRLGLAAWGTVMLLVSAAGLARAGESRWGADYFPNVTLTTQDGVKVRFYDDLIKGKVVAINLIYTTCKYSCPLETARLAQVQKLLGDRMGRDVFFYSITIDPDHDTPAVLKDYGEKFGAGPGWLFLTGSAADIEWISKKLGLYTAPNPANKDGHTPSLVVGNAATGQWMRNSALDNPRFLATTIGSWMGNWKDAKPARSYAEATTLTIDPGRYAFTRHCAPCHAVGTQGPKVGPDLAGITKLRDRQWLERFIESPQRMLEEGDPTTVALFQKYKPLQMPSLNLSPKDTHAIVDYLASEPVAENAARPASGAPPAPRPSGAPAGKPADAASSPAAAPFDVAAILPFYLKAQEALSGDRIADLPESARAIGAVVVAAGPQASSIRMASRALMSARDLDGARAAFGALGDAIMIAAKSSRANLGGDVHVAYCPMVKKYWLQKGTEIRNPFYGRAMLDCGRIVSELPDLQDPYALQVSRR
jgi:protein SCO1